MDRAVACVSSPLRRARQTAEALWSGRPGAVVDDDRWKEMDYGELEGQPVSDVRALVRPRWSQDEDWAPLGGESIAAVSRRVIAACLDLIAAHPGGDVVAVTHVSPIKVAVAWALGVGPGIAGRMNVDLASVTLIDAAAGREPTLLAYNRVNAPRAPGTGGTGGSAG